MTLDASQIAAWERYERVLTYELRLQQAREDFTVFCEMMMPGADPDDATSSKYITKPHHRIMHRVAEAMESKRMLKVCMSMPPRHGKSLTLTTLLAAWFHGLHPDQDVMTVTYGGDKAADFSNDFVEMVNSQRFQQIFPEYGLNPKKNAVDERRTIHGGKAHFVGRRTPITGKGAHLLIIDDPIKDDKEARLDLSKDDLWAWFTKTIYTRRHTWDCPTIITMTRWSTDDLVGRITDPASVYYSEEFAKGWEVLRLAALCEDKNDLLQRDVGEALWPERMPADELSAIRASDPVGFACLYQGNPVPDGGVLFQADDLVEYDLPEYERIRKDLKLYAFSDHATGTTKYHDPSCFAVVGVDGDGDVYVLPDLFWERVETDDAANAMIDMMRRHRLIQWVPEDGAIWKSIQPFVNKRLQEERVFVPINPVWPSGRGGRGKVGRVDPSLTSGLVARCRMRKVKFPGWAPWWPRAKAEMLQFPNGAHDDFVDVMALMASQIDRIHGMPSREPKKTVAKGSWEDLYGDFEDDEVDLAGGNDGWTGRSL